MKHIIYLTPVKLGETTFRFFNIICFLEPEKRKVVPTQIVTLKPVANRTLPRQYAIG